MADYPLAVTSFPTLVTGVDWVEADHMNERGAEIVAIETELGVNPSGTYVDSRSTLERDRYCGGGGSVLEAQIFS